MGEFGTGSNSDKWQHILQFLQVSSFITFKDILNQQNYKAQQIKSEKIQSKEKFSLYWF